MRYFNCIYNFFSFSSKKKKQIFFNILTFSCFTFSKSEKDISYDMHGPGRSINAIILCVWEWHFQTNVQSLFKCSKIMRQEMQKGHRIREQRQGAPPGQAGALAPIERATCRREGGRTSAARYARSYRCINFFLHLSQVKSKFYVFHGFQDTSRSFHECFDHYHSTNVSARMYKVKTECFACKGQTFSP